jgi:hypothetical protein
MAKRPQRKAKKKAKRKASKPHASTIPTRIVELMQRVERIEEFLGDDLKAFHEKQPAASLTNGPQAGALVDPE